MFRDVFRVGVPLVIAIAAGLAQAQDSSPIVIETEWLRLSVGADGTAQGLVDKQTERNYLQAQRPFHLYAAKARPWPPRACPDRTRAPRAGGVRNPSVTVGGRSFTFPTSLTSSEYLGFQGAGDCSVFGAAGETVRAVAPQSEVPLLVPGENVISLNCDSPDAQTRARVTVIGRGEAIP